MRDKPKPPPGPVTLPQFYIPPYDTSSFIDPPAPEQEPGLDPEQLEETPAEHPPAKRKPWQRRTP